MNCKNCANRYICNKMDRARGQACRDYRSRKAKPTGYIFLTAGLFGGLLAVAGEFNSLAVQVAAAAVCGMMILAGALLLGGELDAGE